MDRSDQRFPLSDLLPVPIQRFLKYPLLMKELQKCAKKRAMPAQSEVNNLEKLIDQLEVHDSNYTIRLNLDCLIQYSVLDTAT